MTDEVKRAVGRPSLLTQELIDMANEYMLTKHTELNDEVPSHAGLCCYLGISKSTLYEYGRTDSELAKEFSHTLAAINVKQEKMLLTGGLRGTTNSTITKLMLSNHGYSDKVENDLKSSDGTMSPKSFTEMYGSKKLDSDKESE